MTSLLDIQDLYQDWGTCPKGQVYHRTCLLLLSTRKKDTVIILPHLDRNQMLMKSRQVVQRAFKDPQVTHDASEHQQHSCYCQ